MDKPTTSLRPLLQTRQNRRNHAFTLIELLTVIAIIGILASILIPVVGAVRTRAFTAKCTSNIRQSAIAILQYAADDGSFLMHWGGSGGGRNLWSDRLIDAGYLDRDARSVVFCPSNPPTENLEDRSLANPWATYGINMIGDAGQRVQGDGTSLYRINIENIGDTTRYFLLADSGYPSTRFQRMRISSNQATSMDGIHARHAGKANLAFADGHVALMGSHDLGAIKIRSFFDEAWNITNTENYSPD